MTTLRITHNAGFFSCATIRLIAIMKHFNAHKALPDIVDDAEQFAFYKRDLSDNIIPLLYGDNDTAIEHRGDMEVTREPGEVSFSDYSKFIFEDIQPFINKYFAPSAQVKDIIQGYVNKYNFDYANTCAVFYRGNDKIKECVITPYDDFINKANEMVQANSDIRFLVQPDETEFLEAFTAAFPGRCFWFDETPHMRKKNSAIFYELPPDKKTAHAQYFLAAVITMANCGHLITHSGNGGMWCVLYRGHFNNVHQFFNKHIY